MQSSGPGSATVTSTYTEDVVEEEEEEEEKKEDKQQSQQHKQVDRSVWKAAKPALQQKVDNFSSHDKFNVYKSNSFTIKSV